VKELQTILDAVRKAPDVSCALATVVRAHNSDDYPAGAMLLCLPSGETVGAIGREALAIEVKAAARQILATGKPRVLVFTPDQSTVETGPDEILVEQAEPHFLRTLEAAQQEGRALVVASIFETRGDHRQQLRTLALIDDTGRWRGRESDRTDLGRLWDASRNALATGHSGVLTHHLGDGIATTFLRVIHPSSNRQAGDDQG